MVISISSVENRDNSIIIFIRWNIMMQAGSQNKAEWLETCMHVESLLGGTGQWWFSLEGFLNASYFLATLAPFT